MTRTTTLHHIFRSIAMTVLAVAGLTSIIATEDESGGHAPTNPTVNPDPPIVTLTPRIAYLLPGESVTVTASVANGPWHHSESELVRVVAPPEGHSNFPPEFVGLPALPAELDWTPPVEDRSDFEITLTAAPDARSGSGRIEVHAGPSFTTEFFSTLQVVVLPAGIPSSNASAVAVAAGVDHSLAILDDGSVWSWGGNDFGQLGDGSYVTRFRPVQVTGLAGRAVSVAAGDQFSVAVLDDGSVWSWGINDRHQNPSEYITPTTLTGSNRILHPSPPQPIPAPLGRQCPEGQGCQWPDFPPVTSAAYATASWRHALAAESVTSGGRVMGWGDNNLSQVLATPTETSRGVGAMHHGLPGFAAQVAAGGEFSVALMHDGTVVGWGSNSHGQLAELEHPALVRDYIVPGLDYSAIGAGGEHTLLLRESGLVEVMGRNNYGQLGDSTAENRNSPVVPTGMRNIVATQVAGGDRHSIALRDDGTVLAWGATNQGQTGADAFGEDALGAERNAVFVPGLTGITSIAANGLHNLAIRGECGQVLAWGANRRGQLGNGALAGDEIRWPDPLPVFGFGEASLAPGCPVTLSVFALGDGRGTVSFATIDALDCGDSVCAAAVPKGELVSITASPNGNSQFDGWAGDCVGASPSISVTMNRSRNCYARFSAPGLSAPPVAAFAATPNPAVVGENVSFDATASTDDVGITTYDWNFDDDGTFDANGATTVAVYDSVGSFTARLRVTDGDGQTDEATQQIVVRNPPGGDFLLTITLDNDGGEGRVTSSPAGIDCGDTCSASFASGTTVTLTPEPIGNSTFSHWSGDPDCTDGEVTMSGPRNCTANFVVGSQSRNLVVLAEENGGSSGVVTSDPPGINCGQGNTTCALQALTGDSFTFTATAGPDSTFLGWEGDPTCLDGEVTLVDPLTTCRAVFDSASAPTQVILNISSVIGRGRVTIGTLLNCGHNSPDDCFEFFPQGENVFLRAEPNDGWQLSEWTGDCRGTVDELISVTLDENTDCGATFIQQ